MAQYLSNVSIILLLLCSSCESDSVIGDVRLVQHINDQRLEICFEHNGESCKWSSFCYDEYHQYFNKAAAAVACRQLGFTTNKGKVVGTNNGGSKISMKAICPNVSDYVMYGEYHLLRCKVEKIPKDTACKIAVAISCGNEHDKLKDYQPYEGQVYLSNDDNDESQSYGKVYAYHNGKWLQICSKKFNKPTADSVCRQLGYTNAITWDPLGDGGESKGWLFDSFSCTNSLPCFSHCYSYSSITSAKCNHAVTIQCEFNKADKSIESSGSKQMCSIQSGSTSSYTNKYEAAVVSAIILSIVLVVALAIAMACCIRKNKMCLCHPKNKSEEQQLLEGNQEGNRSTGQSCLS